ncbi:G5 domain-containing protein [Anaerobacillus sp. HL2]|nr:G5 domain-containing protein [Anaerobacillus sp. HL2]
MAHKGKEREIQRGEKGKIAKHYQVVIENGKRSISRID